jgi:hypothetical protein
MIGLLAFLLAMVILGLSDQVSGQWGDVSAIPDSINLSTTDIAIDDGRVYVAASSWYVNHNAWVSCLDGGAWGPWAHANEERLSIGPYPRIDVDDGVIHVVWQDSLDYGGDLDAHYRRCVNGTWDPVMDLSPDDDPNVLYQMPDVAVNGSEVHAIWRQLDWNGPSKDGVFYRHFDGFHWEAPVRLDQPGLEYVPMDYRIAVDGDEVHVVWRQYMGDSWDIYYKRFDGSRWLPAVELSEDLYPGQEQAAPAIAVSHGTVHVVWSTAGPPVQAMYRCAVDGVWQDAKRLSAGAPQGDQMTPCIAAEGDVAFAAWVETRGGSPGIYLRFFNGTAWGPEQEVGDRTEIEPFYSNPVIDVVGGTVHISWSRFLQPNYYPYPVHRAGSFDGEAPKSSAGPVASPWLDVAGTQVPWAASDDYCLANVSLLYSHSTDNLTWSDWALAQTSGTVAGSDLRGSLLFVPPSGDGFYRLQTVAVDLAARREALAPAGDLTMMLDTIPPEGSITIDGGAPWTADSEVTLALAFSDAMTDLIGRSAGRSLLSIRLGSSAPDGLGPWEAATRQRAWDLGPGHGTVHVFYQVRDLAGLVSETYQDDIGLDTVAPTGSIEMRVDGEWTTSPTVMLRVTFQDDISGIDRMRLSDDGVWDDEPWEEPYRDIEWALSDGDGPKTVHFQVMDHCGLLSPVYSDTVVLDTTPPTCSMTIDEGVGQTGSRQVVLHLEFQDATAGPALMRLTNEPEFYGEAWDPLSHEVEWLLTEGSGPKTVSLRVMDQAGLRSEKCSGSVLLDVEAPEGSIVIAQNATLVSSPRVELTLSYRDTTTTVVAMQLGDDGVWDDEPWREPVGSLNWTLQGGEGVRFVHLRLRDAVGHESMTYLDEVTFDSTPPSVTSVSPEDGATGIPATLTITIDLSEPVDGSALAGTVEVLLDGEVVAGEIALSPDGRTLTFRPAALLKKGSTYSIVVGPSLKDLAGNAMGAPFMANFTTWRGAGGGGNGGDAWATTPVLAALALIVIAVVIAWMALRTRPRPRTPGAGGVS